MVGGGLGVADPDDVVRTGLDHVLQGHRGRRGTGCGRGIRWRRRARTLAGDEQEEGQREDDAEGTHVRGNSAQGVRGISRTNTRNRIAAGR